MNDPLRGIKERACVTRIYEVGDGRMCVILKSGSKIRVWSSLVSFPHLLVSQTVRSTAIRFPHQ